MEWVSIRIDPSRIGSKDRFRGTVVQELLNALTIEQHEELGRKVAAGEIDADTYAQQKEKIEWRTVIAHYNFVTACAAVENDGRWNWPANKYLHEIRRYADPLNGFKNYLSDMQAAEPGQVSHYEYYKIQGQQIRQQALQERE